MRVVRWYQSAIRADQASAFLRHHGILAGSVNHNIDFTGGVASTFSGSGYGVTVLSKRQEAIANAVLDDFEMLPDDTDDAQWEQDAVADLTRLDPALLPDCPGCGHGLPPDASLEACPNCGEQTDVAGLIAAEHGPEVLDACYEAMDPEDAITDEMLREIVIDCPSCGYGLDGLGLTGVCPECSVGFDKRKIVSGMLGLA